MRRNREWKGWIVAACSALALIVPSTAPAQQRDFLTTDEVEQVRLAQEPNERLALYNRIAAARMARIQDLLKEDKAGRSVLIHDMLEDLVEIIDTIDIVADDALKNGADIELGMQDVVTKHSELARQLKAIDEMELRDRSRYEFQLQMALDTVQDALELAQEDLAKRKGDLLAREKKERAEREAMRTPKDIAERKEEAAKQEKFEEKAGKRRKAPSLYKPGEKPGGPPPGGGRNPQ